MTQNYIDLSKDFERIAKNIGSAGDIRFCISNMWCMAQMIKNHRILISSEDIEKLHMYLCYVNGMMDDVPTYLKEIEQIIQDTFPRPQSGSIIKAYNNVCIIPEADINKMRNANDN